MVLPSRPAICVSNPFSGAAKKPPAAAAAAGRAPPGTRANHSSPRVASLDRLRASIRGCLSDVQKGFRGCSGVIYGVLRGAIWPLHRGVLRARVRRLPLVALQYISRRV
jgi:hypothetical protein